MGPFHWVPVNGAAHGPTMPSPVRSNIAAPSAFAYAPIPVASQ